MSATLTAPSSGPITSRWGPRPPLPDHHGWDYGFWTTHPDYRVVAAAPGKVVRVFWTSTMGWCIEIDHGGGVHTRYCHLADRGLVNVGDQLTRGQRIGTMGSTGSEAVVGGVRQLHLHFEVIVNGSRVDPAPYFTSTAGGDVTPITPITNRSNTVTLYHKQDSTPTLYALAGDSPGTPANWLETTAQGLANAWSAQIGGPSAAVNDQTWEAYKAAYRAPLTVAGGVSSGVSKADVDAAADRVKAAIPTAEQIAQTVNTDAAKRMQS